MFDEQYAVIDEAIVVPPKTARMRQETGVLTAEGDWVPECEMRRYGNLLTNPVEMPNETPLRYDGTWLWGGTLEQIAYTVAHGIRNETDFDAHWSEMPAFGEVLEADEIETLARFLPTLAEADWDSAGGVLFSDNCAACHGERGLGDRDLGAPNLADAIWLYGGDQDSLVDTITYSRFGVMPAWGQRLSEADVRAVAAYVHSLGGGE